ncbi:MAG TPA: metal-dependent hydrolase [Candidatus Acidoferrales bacterium]|nr:metal-dependent hydrolase [Candidatus Acidoferrales bacterium]
MDPITHGIAGALLGKSFFSKRQERVAIFAATLGAIAPDVDVFYEAIVRDPLGIIRYHRAITHSFLALPFFAALLTLFTWALLPTVKRRYPQFRELEAPPWPVLTLIYAVGIASHILLDGMTSFGTRLWFPVSRERVAWDTLFIIDFTFTAIILAPQVAAWIYRDAAKARARAVRMWVLFALGTLLAWLSTRAAGYPFHLWVAGVVCILFAALFFAPAKGGWGFRVSRAAWCQAGTFAMAAYLVAAALAHHAAMERVKAFAEENHIAVDRIGALPIPPSLLDWGDAIRSPHGVYEAQFDLRERKPPEFRFVPDSPSDPFIARAFQLPGAQLYWGFARFPSIHSFVEDGRHVVELGENRFSDGRRRSPQPFTYQIVFDDAGNVLAEGWLTNGMMQRRMRQMVPQQPLPGGPRKKAP